MNLSHDSAPALVEMLLPFEAFGSCKVAFSKGCTSNAGCHSYYSHLPSAICRMSFGKSKMAGVLGHLARENWSDLKHQPVYIYAYFAG